ncbi:MAG: type IV pilus twitching motility protein PilT [Gemmatimonadales bacterium]
MATLDQPIALLFQKHASAIVLESNQQMVLEIDGTRRAITKQPLSTAQALTMVREIMPEGMEQQLASGDGRVTFNYVSGEHRLDVQADRSGQTIHVVLSPAKPRRSTAAISRPAEALLMDVIDNDRELGDQVVGPTAEVIAKGEERIQELLTYLVESDSSDLHLRVGLPPHYRTHGELVAKDGAAPLTREDIEEMILSIMPERNKQEFTDTNDTDFAYEMVGLARFRANALRDRMGVAAVFRVIPTEILNADQLGLSAEVQKLCYLTKGLVVVTGPTGSGKSTTLAAMIDLINRTRTDHIITIEDPIEFVHPNKKCIVTQRQVGSHTQSFKRALRAALREDPDIVLIGEMRDLETVAIAIETAETGHLVFGTLHTTTAVSTIDRIIDQFPADRQEQIRVMLSESLKGVIAQVLLKKKGGGRVAAREVLLSIAAVTNLIREGKTFQLPSTIQTNKRLGMISLNDALIQLVDDNIVEPAEAYMKAVDKAGMETLLQGRGITLDPKDT